MKASIAALFAIILFSTGLLWVWVTFGLHNVLLGLVISICSMFVLSYVLQVSDELENNENKSDAAFSLWIFMAAVSNFLPLLLFV